MPVKNPASNETPETADRGSQKPPNIKQIVNPNQIEEFDEIEFDNLKFLMETCGYLIKTRPLLDDEQIKHH